MGKNKSQAKENEKLINSAIQYGLGVLAKDHPSFNLEYIKNHVDERALKEKLEEISEEIGTGGFFEGRKGKKLYKTLADYVASGNVLDDEGKKVILRGGLEEKAKSGFFRGFFARRELKKEKYLDKVIGAFKDLYLLISTGNYADKMPELTEAATTIYRLDFFDSAMDILNSRGVMSNRKYKLIKKKIRETIESTAEPVLKNPENYFQQATAAILGGLGLLLFFASSTITGGVIGSMENNEIRLIGAVLFFIALFILFLIVKKKKVFGKNKSKTFKNKKN